MNDLSTTWLKAADLQYILDTFQAERRHSEISNDDFKILMKKAVKNVYGTVPNCSDALEATHQTIRHWMNDGCSVRTTRFTVRNLILSDTKEKLELLMQA